jgi:COP9 signalosome complex subunit 4
MENVVRAIDSAVESNELATIQSIFSQSGGSSVASWLSVGQGEQRSIAAHFIVTVVNHPNFMESSMSSLMDTYMTVLGHLPATVENAADNTLRQALFQYMVSQMEDYTGAARILSGMRMQDQGVYQMTPAEKTDIYVKIAECFLAEDEIVESDSAVQKAGVFVEQISNKEQHMALILRYKSTYARVLDANRKFLTAASRYHELSQSTSDVRLTEMCVFIFYNCCCWSNPTCSAFLLQVIDADDLLHMLGRAVTCAILAPSGPQRQRVLGSIVNDKRLSTLDSLPEFSTHRTILKKMYTHQIVRPQELVHFGASLADHQKAIMGDGLTIMERAVVEHNMIAVADLYESIYLAELAWILGVAENKAEKIAATMIMDGSLKASIDQVDGLLLFSNQETPIEAYDRLVNHFCVELNTISNAIKTDPSRTG